MDINNGGWEGLIAAQECIPTNETRDTFAADYGVLAKLWEAISPDPYLTPYKETYRWLTQVYESVKPVNIIGPLLWQKLGAKTIEIINENIHVVGISDDFGRSSRRRYCRDLLDSKDPKKGKRLEIRIIKRLRKHAHNPVFIQLGERLELIKERYEQGFIDSLDYLRQLIQLARDVVEAEKQVEPLDARKKAKAALTELFEETRTDRRPSSSSGSSTISILWCGLSGSRGGNRATPASGRSRKRSERRSGSINCNRIRISLTGRMSISGSTTDRENYAAGLG